MLQSTSGLSFGGERESASIVKKHKPTTTATTTTTTVVKDTAHVPRTLSAEEERVLRMRSGATLAVNHRLESKLEGVHPSAYEDVAARLRLIEAQLLDEIAERAQAREPSPRSIEKVQPKTSRKSRIVAALKSKPIE